VQKALVLGAHNLVWEDNILLKSTLIGKAVQLGDTNVRSDIVRLA
jgi:hypothetical protein